MLFVEIKIMLENTRLENEKNYDRVLDDINKNNIRFINLQFTDILGFVKSVTIPVSQLKDCLKNGKWFDGSSIEGFNRIAESDMFLLPDLSTYKAFPWENKDGNHEARIICWICNNDGGAFEGDPRVILAKVLEEAEEIGYIFNTAPELEFFLFNKKNGTGLTPLPHDDGGYFDFTTDEASEIRKTVAIALEKMGIEVESIHHEFSTGQHEIDFKYDNALKTADNSITFKYTLKTIAQKHNLYGTFMPKPIYGINGSGMHTHQSLFNKSGENAFVDTSDEYGLSKLARQFIAGQMHHAGAMCAILAPTVNSYKRLVPGYKAPVFIGWAQANPSVHIRIPRVPKSSLVSTRIEIRCPDPSCNPYLAFAVMLKAGLDGIKRELEPPEPTEQNLYNLSIEEKAKSIFKSLPASLGEALMELKKDNVVKSVLGEHVYEHFYNAKMQEWTEFRKYVSEWELERYLSVI